MRGTFLTFALLVPICFSHAQEPAADKVLYDFEDPADLKSWSNLEVPGAKEKEPAVTIGLATDHATSGKHSLKLTFAGGEWPKIATTAVTQDWLAYPTFKADVTVPRDCLIGFALHQEKSMSGNGYEAMLSRWVKSAFLQAGKNTVVATLLGNFANAINPKWGNAVRFEIFMYHPHAGETIHVDHIRLSKDKVPATPRRSFAILGTDWTVSGTNSAEACQQLGRNLAKIWNPPAARTLEQIEQEFLAQHDLARKRFPKRHLAILRDGEPGYDPAQPDKVYAGWKDAYWSSHGPDAAFVERARNRGQEATQEIFMRHRSPLMRVDLSSIPKGSNILAAQLIIVRSVPKMEGYHDPAKHPTMWVVEPCNRPWEEFEVNTFQYAKDRFWKDIGGWYWEGDNPDFHPIFLTFGPSRPGPVTNFEFTQAIRYWTDGKRANHGFMLHGDSVGYMTGHAREAADVKNRPAVLVSYVPN